MRFTARTFAIFVFFVSSVVLILLSPLLQREDEVPLPNFIHHPSIDEDPMNAPTMNSPEALFV